MSRAARIEARLQQAWLGRGWLARTLWPLSCAFGAVAAARRQWLSSGRRRATPLPVPVIVVGNLIAGGAGKTPSVLALVALLRRHGYTPGIVSRGYGRRSTEVREVWPQDSPEDAGDEPLLLRIRAGVPVVVGRDRADAARHLLRRHPHVDALVSDDGLQHRQLHRDLQLIVFDERGAGNGWLLPAGPLREPLPDPAALDAGIRSWVVYNADRPTTPLPGTCVHRRLGAPVPLADWWRGDRSSTADWRRWSGKPLVAAAGIARPERFFAMLRAQGLQFEAFALPDHDPWLQLPWPAATADAIVSEKDAIKLRPERVGATRVWVAPLDFQFDAALEHELLEALGAIARARQLPRHHTAQEIDGHPTA